ncbi:MAG: hypothetical protein ABFS23_11135 [Pseudomonadota bacterium]
MSMSLKVSKANAGQASGGAFLSRTQFQGDPGLFGFLGKAVKTIGGAVLGSTPIGGAVGTVAGFLGGRATVPTTRPFVGPVRTQGISGGPTGLPSSPFFAPPQEVVPKPGVRGFIERTLPGGKTGFVVNGAAGAAGAPSVACGPGFHPNKSDYFLKDGTFVEKGSRCVKNRRRNPLNPRAASRAIGRLESAKKATKRLNRITIRCNRCGKANCTCR